MHMKKYLPVVFVAGLIFAILSPISSNAVSSNPTPVCAGATCTITFTYTGDYYQWSAPATGTYTLEVWGAQGGGVGANYWGVGGRGGYAKGDISLSNGQTLYIYPGQQGFQSSTVNAFNGGGKANFSTSYGTGWTGGGATHIATAVGQLSALSGNTSAVKIVAGGGGGAAGSQGYAGFAVYSANGGAGGGTSGSAGASSNNETSYRAGGGAGTQVSGGTSVSSDVASGFGRGADAQAAESDAIQGGGGGGGWYGGGAGQPAGGGGGGGSGYVGGVTASIITVGNTTMPNPAGGTMSGNSGNGIARITYSNSPAVVSLSTAGNSLIASKGQVLVLTATSDSLGTVTFFANGKKITGCASRPIPVGTRTCAWKAAIQKPTRLWAVVTPANGAPIGYSSEISVSVVKRTGTR